MQQGGNGEVDQPMAVGDVKESADGFPSTLSPLQVGGMGWEGTYSGSVYAANEYVHVQKWGKFVVYSRDR